MKGATFLALDLSTQSLKGILLSDTLHVLRESTVQFGRDLLHYKTENGVIRSKNSSMVTSPTCMWVEAVDLLLCRMKEGGCDFSSVACLSGTGQQHGSVYWKCGSEDVLKTMKPMESMLEQLKDCFAIENSPIWMDSSTTAECRKLEELAGGRSELASLTGSAAYERFTGNQIAKIFKEQRASYDNCERISLVSSFLASLFLGGYAPIDYSDGSGMNLLNIKSCKWESKLIECCGTGLSKRLGEPIPSYALIGNISQYMVERYGFSPSCQLSAFTGDNPASLAGMRLQKDDVAISLGTSDTLIFTLKDPKPSAEIGHVFVNPVTESHFMALLCYKNGSLARESIRDKVADRSWEVFNKALDNTPPGNNGNTGIYFLDQEIIPFAKGLHRWGESGQEVEAFSNDVEVRALVEGQFMAKRNHAEQIGFHRGPNTRILATGGASSNAHLLQIIADIFGASVYTLPETSNSACLGSAYRARHSWMNAKSPITFEDSLSSANIDSPYTLSATPRQSAMDVYEHMRMRYAELEKDIV